MPVKVKCTSCGEELTLPDDLVGKQATCPRCRKRMSIAGGSITQSASGKWPPGTAAPGASAGGAATPTAPAAAPAGAVLATQSVSDVEIAKFLGNPRPPGSTTIQDTRSVAQAAPTSVPATPSGPPPAATTKSATFIIADATARRIELGASGQLPRLVLDEAQKKEVPEEKTEGSKTWLLLAAVVGSVVLSVGLLFVDMSGGKTESGLKSQARKTIENRYVNDISPTIASSRARPLLAQAIQAYNRGDVAEEKRLYRQVLDLLHWDGKDVAQGITGSIKSDTLPNDTELEEQIMILLREN